MVQVIRAYFSLNAYFLFSHCMLSITRRILITCTMMVKKIALVRDVIELGRVLE